MTKLTKRICIGAGIVLTISAWCIGSSVLPKNIDGAGTIQILGNNQWGVSMRWNLLRPLADRTFRLSSVTEEFQHDGMKVQLRASIADVIGSGEWDTVVTLESITRQ